MTGRTTLADVADDVFGTTYERHFRGMVAFAYLTTGSAAAAEDIVQEAFIDLYRRRAQVREPERWLRRAVASRCTSWVRRRILERRHAFADPTRPVTAPHESASVRAALRRIRPRQRAALFLRYYLDLPEREIAETLGCPAGTVKTLLHRGLAALREHLDD
ncbi:sigma-70 family RNA polymerase sigma factor [Micromonospora sp. NPDC047730]|uniref:sigma-70 family RNA polymerase sigma factor n=1 Tax=Micromonospora sp. NPDC047730 TaxID=3364253 RepID=UPI00371B65F8